MPVTTRSDPAHHLVLVVDRLVADRIGIPCLDRQRDELALPALLFLRNCSRAADEFALGEVDEAAESSLIGPVDRPVFARPAAEGLFQPHRVEGAAAEMPQRVGPARSDQQIVERALIFRRDPDFVTQVAREGNPAHQRRHHADMELAETHERKSLVGEVFVHQLLQQRAAVRAGHRQTDVFHGAGPHRHAGAGLCALEPPQVVLFSSIGADEEYAILGEPAQREIADQSATLVEHRRERQAPDLRHLAGHDPRQPVGGSGTGDLELAVIADLDQADAVAHRAAFGGHVRMRVGAAKGHVLARLAPLGREPQGMLEAAVFAEHRVLGLQALVHRRGAQWPRGVQLFVRKTDAEAARIILAHLGVGIFRRGPVAVAGNVHGPDVGARVALGHPVGERKAHAAALAEAGHDAAGHPVVPQALDRAYQRIAVGREGKGAVHDLANADLGQPRKMFERHFQTWGDAFQIIGQQILAEIPGRHARRPGNAGTLVGAEQHAAAFLAQIEFAFEIDAVHLLLLPGEFRQILGDQVLVLHGQHRQLEAHHAADLAGPQAAGIHNMLRVHRPPGGDHIPGTVGALPCVDDPRLPHDLGARQLRRLRVGERDAGRIDVAFDGIEYSAQEMLHVHERIDPGDLGRGHQLEFHAEVTATRLRHLQPVHALARTREHDAAGDVHSTGLPRDLLDFAVQLDGVLLQLGDVRVAIHGMHAARCVPGGSGSELGALEQLHVLPAGLGEVVQDAGADDSAADHGDPDFRFHV